VRLPIRVRLTAWYVVVLAVILVLVGAFVVVRLRGDLVGAVDDGLRPATAQIAAGYHAEGAPEATDVARTVLAGERAASQVLDPRGGVVVAWGDPVARRPMLSPGELRRVLGGERLVRTSELGAPDRSFRVVAQAATRHGRPYAVVAGESLAGVGRSVHRVLVLLLVAGPIALLVAALGGWWLARRAMRPVQRMTARAAGIGAARMEERLAVPATGDEIARLAVTLNTMLDRIQAGVEDQRRLVADASHELRTPLAVMRSEIEVSLLADELSPDARRVLESACEEVERMSRTVDGLLLLASADEDRLHLLLEPVDLRRLAEATARALAGLAEGHRVAVEVEGEPALVLADPERLGQALRNLVDNAIAFSPAGAVVRVRTWAGEREAGVEVADEGPGVPPDLRERVFDRFFRADPGRARRSGGSGIGLSIVREVARAHGGHVELRPRAPRGSAFVLTLPALEDPDATTLRRRSDPALDDPRAHLPTC
jgi:heavy metal sensor kinase